MGGVNLVSGVSVVEVFDLLCFGLIEGENVEVS